MSRKGSGLSPGKAADVIPEKERRGRKTNRNIQQNIWLNCVKSSGGAVRLCISWEICLKTEAFSNAKMGRIHL